MRNTLFGLIFLLIGCSSSLTEKPQGTSGLYPGDGFGTTDRRQGSAEALALELETIDRLIAEQLAAADSAFSPLSRWGVGLQARTLMERRTALIVAAQRLEPPVLLQERMNSRAEVTERLAHLAAQVGFSLDIAPDPQNVLSSMVICAFAGEGLRLAPKFSAELQVKSKISGKSQEKAFRIVMQSRDGRIFAEGVISPRPDSGSIELLVRQLVAAVREQAPFEGTKTN